MIEVGRNSIVVRNVDLKSEEYKKAQYIYSLYDKVIHKYTFSAFLEENGDLYFPSSITVEELQKVFPTEEVAVDFKNTAKAKSCSFEMVHQPKDELQRKSIQFLMKMKKDLETHQRFLSLDVVVMIPDGVDASKVTVEVAATVETVKANGANVKVKKFFIIINSSIQKIILN